VRNARGGGSRLDKVDLGWSRPLSTSAAQGEPQGSSIADSGNPHAANRAGRGGIREVPCVAMGRRQPGCTERREEDTELSIGETRSADGFSEASPLALDTIWGSTSNRVAGERAGRKQSPRSPCSVPAMARMDAMARWVRSTGSRPKGREVEVEAGLARLFLTSTPSSNPKRHSVRVTGVRPIRRLCATVGPGSTDEDRPHE